MRGNLPSYRQALQSLRETGEMLERPYTGWGTGVEYQHPKGAREIVVDDRILPEIGNLYTNNQALSKALNQRGARTIGSTRAIQVLSRALSDKDGVVWGFSGYASAFPGVNYYAEADGIEKFYEHFNKIGHKPNLVVDGGVSAGVLGINGIVARQFKVPTLGFIPLEGLGSMGPRDHMVITGATYQDREKTVAAAAEILVCWGGKEGTTNECVVAVEDGSFVILPIFRTYEADSLPEQFLRIPELKRAFDREQLIICDSPNKIPECVAKALAGHRDTKHWNRARRREKLTKFLR